MSPNPHLFSQPSRRVNILAGMSLLAFASFHPLAESQTGQMPTASQTTPVPKAAQPTSRKWSSLTSAEQLALKPLAADWNQIGPERQKKWLEISRNFDKMPPPQQQALHERMSEWARMTPTQRNQARLNFAETQKVTQALSPEEKRAKWEAYQALSPEEKQKLAKEHPAAKTAAPVIKPVPAQKLTSLPAGTTTTQSGVTPTKKPRIAGTDQLQSRTLLPASVAAPQPAPAR